MLKTMEGNSLLVIKNSGRHVIFKLRTIFGRKILFFYLNLNILNVKIKRFNSKSKQIQIELQPIAPAKQTRCLRIIADCARWKVARATQTRRYGFHCNMKSEAKPLS